MKRIVVPVNANDLIRRAEYLATEWAKTRISTCTEAQLRARIASAKFAIRRYRALIAAAEEHQIARVLINDARELREHSLFHLRRCLRDIGTRLSSPQKDGCSAADQLMTVAV